MPRTLDDAPARPADVALRSVAAPARPRGSSAAANAAASSARLGDAGRDVRPRDERRIADDGDASETPCAVSRDHRSAARIGSSIMRTTSRNCGASSRSAAARICPIASRRISGGGIDIVWVLPASSVSSA
jgi:hypothetical protein